MYNKRTCERATKDKNEIIEYLERRSEPVKSIDILNYCKDRPESEVYSDIQSLKQAGVIRRVARGTYVLVKEDEQIISDNTAPAPLEPSPVVDSPVKWTREHVIYWLNSMKNVDHHKIGERMTEELINKALEYIQSV
jgi:hypothetical protein